MEWYERTIPVAGASRLCGAVRHRHGARRPGLDGHPSERLEHLDDDHEHEVATGTAAKNPRAALHAERVVRVPEPRGWGTTSYVTTLPTTRTITTSSDEVERPEVAAREHDAAPDREVVERDSRARGRSRRSGSTGPPGRPAAARSGTAASGSRATSAGGRRSGGGRAPSSARHPGSPWPRIVRRGRCGSVSGVWAASSSTADRDPLDLLLRREEADADPERIERRDRPGDRERPGGELRQRRRGVPAARSGTSRASPSARAASAAPRRRSPRGGRPRPGPSAWPRSWIQGSPTYIDSQPQLRARPVMPGR